MKSKKVREILCTRTTQDFNDPEAVAMVTAADCMKAVELAEQEMIERAINSLDDTIQHFYGCLDDGFAEMFESKLNE